VTAHRDDTSLEPAPAAELAKPPLRGELVERVQPIEPPSGPGVILTAARWLPGDGTWETAYAGQWQTEWRVLTRLEDPDHDLDDGDEPAPCPTCKAHDTAHWPDRFDLVYARPVNRPADRPALDATVSNGDT
jgi:hypothetical protein